MYFLNCWPRSVNKYLPTYVLNQSQENINPLPSKTKLFPDVHEHVTDEALCLPSSVFSKKVCVGHLLGEQAKGGVGTIWSSLYRSGKLEPSFLWFCCQYRVSGLPTFPEGGMCLLSYACQWEHRQHSWNSPLGAFPKIRRHYTRPRLVYPDSGRGTATAQNLAAAGKSLSSPQGLGGYACHMCLNVVQWNFTHFRCVWWSGSCWHAVTSKGSFYPPHNLSFTLPSIWFSTPLPASAMLISLLSHTPRMLLVWCPAVSWTVALSIWLAWLPGWFHGSGVNLLHDI